jgi:hypothetical protein
MQTEEGTNRQYYLCDYSGELICVANFAGAMLDVPVASTDMRQPVVMRSIKNHGRGVS